MNLQLRLRLPHIERIKFQFHEMHRTITGDREARGERHTRTEAASVSFNDSKRVMFCCHAADTSLTTACAQRRVGEVRGERTSESHLSGRDAARQGESRQLLRQRSAGKG